MEERKGFGTTFGFLMAAVGSAVGLGNIWGFPNKMGANGGFTFLVIYLILAALCGFIVMVGELALGRKTGRGVISTYKILTKRFKWLGWLGIIAPFLILSFYCALGGYCIKYVTVNLGNLFNAGFGTGGLGGAEVFGGLLTNQGESVIYGLIFVLITLLIVMCGVSNGIEKVCSVGMPALFILLVICIIRACTLGGNDFTVAVLQADGSTVQQVIHSSALDGLKYMFQPGYVTSTGYYEPAKALVDGAMVGAVAGVPVVKHVTEIPNFISILATAGGQMFFSLSLGMGIMITYGSYLDKKQNVEKNALVIVVCDTLIALMAGLAVMPSRFALDAAGAVGGPKLLFITMQNVFDKMGSIGPIFGILFYLLVVFAAISSSISLLEVIVAHFVDDARDAGKGDKRKPYSIRRCRCPVRAGVPGRPGRKRHCPRHPAEHRGQRLERLLAGLLRLRGRGYPDAPGRSADVHLHRLGAGSPDRGRRVLPGGQPLQEQGILQRVREVYHPHHHDPDSGRSAGQLLRPGLVLLMEPNL